MGYVLPIFTFLLFSVSEVVLGEKCTLFAIYGLFLVFLLEILLQLKNFSKNLCVSIILVLDAIFVPNFTFLGILSPEISVGEKTVACPTNYSYRQQSTYSSIINRHNTNISCI